MLRAPQLLHVLWVLGHLVAAARPASHACLMNACTAKSEAQGLWTFQITNVIIFKLNEIE